MSSRPFTKIRRQKKEPGQPTPGLLFLDSHGEYLSAFPRRLILVVLQANLELFNRFVGGFKRFHAVPTKVMGGVFHVLLRTAQRSQCLTNLRMRFCRNRLRSGGWLRAR